jgi:hypothetical protein
MGGASSTCENMRNAWKILFESLKGGNHSADKGVEGRIILR